MSENNWMQILDLAGFYIMVERFCVVLNWKRFGSIEFDIGSGLTELKGVPWWRYALYQVPSWFLHVVAYGLVISRVSCCFFLHGHIQMRSMDFRVRQTCGGDPVPVPSTEWRSAARSSSSLSAGMCWRGWGTCSAPGTAGSSAAAADTPSPSCHFWSVKRGARGFIGTSSEHNKTATTTEVSSSEFDRQQKQKQFACLVP